MISAQEQVITPAMAANWLAKNTINRNLYPALVKTYAEDMELDRWQNNGETIKFSEEGTLLDGQHRLHAIVKVNKSVRMVVARGVAIESFRSIDTGMRRSNAQILAMDGVTSSAIVASACRWIVMLENNRTYSHKNSVTTAQVFDALQRHPVVSHFATRHHEKGSKSLLPSASLAVLVLASHKYGLEIVNDFLDAFASGVGLKKGDPAYELRERMIANSCRVAKLNTQTIVAMTVKAVRAHCQSKIVGVLRWTPNEEFPQV
jgi:hypothetical protein